ncbi:rho GTPase-activating protein 23 [Sardina pilchardus]|uniref:rho GTPase-activating protein 23 n=1 Tax=Sardina pilchardus TaxID=27697 RepID=UPI002E14D9E4
MAQAKGRRDGISSANERARPLSGEGVVCPGPRTVVLQKNSQGFGFTLRHFIVYPPESALHTTLKDEENGNGKGSQRNRLEPMDTIFVKSVRDKGPAHQAGLCTGDRLVKVNGESVLGKTYSQVIALIQNSESVLELSIMPKNEDVLQLVSAYSDDAYLKGNDPYTGGAENLPEPPPVCYPGRKSSSAGLQPGQQPPNHVPQAGQNHGPADNLNCRSATTTAAVGTAANALGSPLDNRTGASGGSECEDVRHQLQGPPPRARSSSSAGLAVSPLDFHFANHNAAIAQASASASLLPPAKRKGSLPGARSDVCHRALSDWYYSQAAVVAMPGEQQQRGPPGTMPTMSPRHRSISQDRLAELGLALGNHHGLQHQHHRSAAGGGGSGFGGQWPHSASQDTLLLHYGAALGGGRGSGGGGGGGGQHGGQDSFWLGGWGASGPASRSCSENLLAAYEAYEHTYERSRETLEQASALVSPSSRYERPPPAWPPHLHLHQHQHQHQHHGQPIRPGDRTGQSANHRTAIAATVPPPGRTGQSYHHHHHQQQQHQQQHQQQQMVPQAQARRLPAGQTVHDQTVGYRSYSPSFCRKAGHLMQQSHSFRDPSYTGPHLSWTPTPKTSPPDASAEPSSASTPPSSPPTTADSHESSSAARRSSGSSGQTTTDEAAAVVSSATTLSLSPLPGPQVASPTPLALTQEVVLRQKPPAGRRNAQAMRHTHYALPVDASHHALAPGRAEPQRRPNGSLASQPTEPDSLASIPFIDEPTSPSVDLCARHVPASSVVSSGLRPAPVPTTTSVPASAPVPAPTPAPTTATATATITSPLVPPLPSPLAKLFSSECSNAKNSRRSSYLLAITTERSKSCDEGLNTFREESRVFSRLPKRVKSFFTDGSLESLRAAEEARSKRHSTSELGSITLTDVRKEGWLHYKQILTEKGKKVGGGMRPWKRVFSVLRTHSLFLYKDKREAVLHGAGAGGHGPAHGEDEQPISIRGCLIDIAYSETKRKHTLRLTTQDFCEYLLQAEDREDMLGWIRVIRENSKTDSEDLGFSRQALINKKLNDYRKQSPTGNKPDTSPRVHRMMPPFLLPKTDNTSGTNRSPKTDGKDESSPPKTPWGINIMKKGKKTGPKAFGVRLEDCQPGVHNKFVPLIVEVCCSLVESMGLDYTGIYRVPGNNAMVSALQEQLNKGMEINTTEEKWQDLNVISSLLKSFFRKLPEPLFTDDKYNDFIDANRLEEAGDRLKTLRKLTQDLPDHYFHTLKFLVGHLKTVADNSEKNKMEPRNLALVFGPTLVRTSEDNMTDMVTHMPDRYKIIETLVVHHAWFFSDDLDKDEKTPEDQRDLQPIPNIDHLLPNIGRTIPLCDASDSTNSDSVKSKDSPASKKDLSAKDFLPLSIISAVTRKRKKHQSACPPGNSTDEDSEHEPVKASNYGGKKSGAEEEEEEDDGNEDEEGEEEEEEEEEEEDRKGGCAIVGSERQKDEEGIERAREKTEGQQGSQRGGGGGKEEEEEGERKRNQSVGREERKGGPVRATAAWQGDGNYCAMTPGGQVSSSKEDGERRQGGQAVPQTRHPAPRSFLYTHAARNSPKSPPPPLPLSPSLVSPPMSPRHPSSSSFSSSLLSSPSASLSPTSPAGPFGGGGDPLTRKKLRRGERVRPHSMYSESRSRAGSADDDDHHHQGGGGVAGGYPSTSTASPTSPVAPGFARPPESPHATSPTVGSPPPCHPADWTEPSASVPAGQVWRPGRGAISPETRRRRRDWRRHTVVVSLSGEG